MKLTPFAAFGSLVFVCDADAGETRTVSLGDDGTYQGGLYFYTKGLAKNVVKETGEDLGDRPAGWLNLEHPGLGAATGGTVEVTYVKDTQWLCVPSSKNPKLPNLEKLSLKKNKTVDLVVGDDVFVIRGTLKIGDRTFTGPTQVRVRLGDVKATATEEVQAVYFR